MNVRTAVDVVHSSNTRHSTCLAKRSLSLSRSAAYAVRLCRTHVGCMLKSVYYEACVNKFIRDQVAQHTHALYCCPSGKNSACTSS